MALIVIGATFAHGVKFFGQFIANLQKPTGVKLTFEIFEGEKITGVILGKPLILATFDPSLKKVDILEAPHNLYLEVGDYGVFLADEVYNLSSDGQDGVQLLAGSLSASFAIPVDFYLDFGQVNLGKEEIFEWREKISEAGSLFWVFQIPSQSSKFLKTNLTLFDQLKLFWQLRQVRKDKFNYQIIPSGNFEELILPNGDKAVKVSQDGLTPEIATIFHDLAISQEGLTVVVYNAARKPGLAQVATKICQNLGVQASVGGAAEQILPTTQILVRANLANTLTVKRLIKTFGGKIAKQTNLQPADIVILAGSDLAEELVF